MSGLMSKLTKTGKRELRVPQVRTGAEPGQKLLMRNSVGAELGQSLIMRDSNWEGEKLLTRNSKVHCDRDCGQVVIRVKDQVDSWIESKFSRAHCWNARNTLVFSADRANLFTDHRMSGLLIRVNISQHIFEYVLPCRRTTQLLFA